MIRPPPDSAPPPAPLVPGLPADPRRWLVEVIQIVLVAALLYLVVTTLVARPVRVELTSMLPALRDGDHLLVDRLSPRWDPYARGDVVVFEAPDRWNPDRIPFVKRVIALPGETVELVDGRVFVTTPGSTARRLDEPYVEDQPTLPAAASGLLVWSVPADSVFVLGDNRRSSIDSRAFGPIALDRVVGRAWLRYLPLDRIGLVTSDDGVPR